MNITFQTKVAGIPCICQVTHYSPGHPGKITGPMEEAEEPMDEEFDYLILDAKGRPCPVLQEQITSQDDARLLEEFHVTLLARKHGYDE